ncbi:MAG: AAA family ATPase, partial [Gemmataceae bacterium]
YPLPEAQIDRFMFKLLLDYPSKDEELAILERMGAIDPSVSVDAVLAPEDLFRLRKVIDGIFLDDRLKRYLVDLVRATRHPGEYGLDLGPFIQLGASPRATIYLGRGARAQAFLSGRSFVLPQDIKDIAPDVLRHRISVTYEAEAEEITSDHLLAKILAHLPIP